jgi:hypothetical protein
LVPGLRRSRAGQYLIRHRPCGAVIVPPAFLLTKPNHTATMSTPAPPNHAEEHGAKQSSPAR